MSRRPQLDALRGIAVTFVVVHHWMPWVHGIGLGNVGVQLFFVISGFLISGILLDQRLSLANHETGLWRALGTFFARRAARIWPVMFVTLALVWIAGDRFERREDMIWHTLFGSNLLFFQRGEFGSSLAHFWSLAVEQQFYLVWPFVILLLPRTWLEVVIIASILIAPLTRLALVGQGYTHFAEYNGLPFANLDSLGVGALMALWLRLPSEIASGRWRLFRYAICLAASGLFLALFTLDAANTAQTAYAVLFGGLIVQAYSGIKGACRRLLEHSALVALGTISYGVYVYHVFVPRAVGMALRSVNAPEILHSGTLFFLLSGLLTLLVAGLSWRLMERPILALGYRVPHASPALPN